jgi:hypothetical protein
MENYELKVVVWCYILIVGYKMGGYILLLMNFK